MTEYEILDLIVERRQELISIVQWWASISVGIIAASQLLERYLNAPLLVVILAFYVFYTFAVYRFIGALFGQLMSAFEDLERVAEPSAQAAKQLEQLGAGVIGGNTYMTMGVLGLVVAATCLYPIWMYMKVHAEGT